MRERYGKLFVIIIGSIIYGLGINGFVLANGLGEGGFIGIVLLIHYATGIPVGLMSLVFNIPLLIIGYRLWGKEFVGVTTIGVVCNWIALDITANFQVVVDDLLLAGMYGGLLMGVGSGMILRFGANTGGGAILAKIANHFTGISIGRFYLISDCSVLMIFALVHGLTITLYSLVTIFIFSKVVDLIVDGLDAAKQATIISSEHEVIGEFIRNELGRGLTYIDGRGGYGNEEKKIILCIVNKWQIFRLKQYIREVDRNAFIIVSEAYEVLGNGFRG